VSLPKPRRGEKIEPISCHPYRNYVVTIAEPEEVIWASIKQLCSRNFADRILHDIHSVRDKRTRKAMAHNIKLYIQRAFEFYDVAQNAETATSPLLYYYSFLNLAKALSEIRNPRFHRNPENYRHGITWRPNKYYVVGMHKEKISLTTRGVWHALFEAVSDYRCPAKNPTSIRIKDLFELCPEISDEFGRVFHLATASVFLKDISIFKDQKKKLIWLNILVNREELESISLTTSKFTRSLASYRRVYTEDSEMYKYELKYAKKYIGNNELNIALYDEIKDLNLFTFLENRKITYTFSMQDNLSFKLPQIMVLYTLMFWLGSLVRYDPHSVARLQESQYWLLIDGFMTQSKIWLLEQFEWYFYKTEKTLVSGR
jgi:hypothetical protein